MTNSGLLIGILIGVVALLLVGGAVGWLLYRRYARAALVRLVGHREGIRAAYRALEATFASLSEETAEEMLSFAEQPDNVRRKALEELNERLTIEVGELGEMALPKNAWPAADLLMDAATCVRDEIGKITGAGSPEGVLAAVAALDVEAMRTAMAKAGAELEGQLQAAKIKDAAVYGGGLYI